MNNYTYITVLANDLYLKGVLVLNESLKQVKSKYELVVLIGKNVSAKSKKILKYFNIQYIENQVQIELSDNLKENNIKAGYDFWNNTFLKLNIFELTQFKKMVFLDCDMIVLSNIDNLFDKPSMSGVATETHLGNPGFSSGIIVFEPQKNATKEMLEILKKIEANKTNNHFGDEVIIAQWIRDWDKKQELHLDISYGMLVGYVPHYLKTQNYEKPIKVLHFVGRKKPWMNPFRHIEYYFKHFIRQEWFSLKIYFEYDKQLINIFLKLLFKPFI